MKKIVFLMVFFIALSIPLAGAENVNEEIQRVNAIQKAVNATVKIEIVTYQSETGLKIVSSFGSGFFVSSNDIATNAHVVMKPGVTAIKVTKSNGTECSGKLGYRDEGWDLALVTTDCTGEPLTTASYATVGQDAYIIGSSTVDFAVTQGIVSKLEEKSHLLVNIYAAHGDSGGAMVNSDGKVIGVVRSGEAPFIYGIPIKYINAFLKRAGV